MQNRDEALPKYSTVAPAYPIINSRTTLSDRDCSSIQLLSMFFIDSDFCHNYLHTLYSCLRVCYKHMLCLMYHFSAPTRTIHLVIVSNLEIFCIKFQLLNKLNLFLANQSSNYRLI